MPVNRITIVMYHYVRPIAASDWPRIKGLELNLFRGQLDYIQHHYNPISMEHLVAATAGNSDLPANPILLTFDDGYSDHYHYVSKELSNRGMSGAFYAPACALLDRRILDVNRIHYILAAVDDPSTLVVVVDQGILDSADEFQLATPSELRRAINHTSRWDTPEVSFVKRMLQDGLPRTLRTRLIDKLFAKFVTSDATGFAEELYMNVDQAREMIEQGMHIGSHGEHHERLSLVSPEDQRQEIEDSLRIYSAIGQPTQGFTFCYPYGDYDQNTIKILEELGCSAAVTTHVGLAEIETPLELARINTNDLPSTANAERNSWTLDAASLQ